VPSETHKQKEKDSSAKYLAHSTTTLTTPSPHSDDANIVLIDTLEIEEQLATTITDGTRIGVERETSLTDAQIASINQKKETSQERIGQAGHGLLPSVHTHDENKQRPG